MAGSGYRITSAATPAYNCLAWAAGETHRWWDLFPGGGSHWPTEPPPALSLASVIAAFATLGYRPCADARLVPGFEKVALYADRHGWPTHVARQLASGRWTSKHGSSEDIKHATLEALEGELYGKVTHSISLSR